MQSYKNCLKTNRLIYKKYPRNKMKTTKGLILKKISNFTQQKLKL